MKRTKTHWRYAVSHGSGGWYWTTYKGNRQMDFVGPYQRKAEAHSEAEKWMESKRRAWEGSD